MKSNLQAVHPQERHLPSLHRLWMEAFSEPEFWNTFLWKGCFRSNHCLCILEEEEAIAALYWFDCSLHMQKIAYVYAVATAVSRRGRGLCKTLMEQTHAHLQACGYSSVMLVPDGKELPVMYGKMGYRFCTQVEEFSVDLSEGHLPSAQIEIEEIDEDTYASSRKSLLPGNSVVQEGDNLHHLRSMTSLYSGRNVKDDEAFLLAAYVSKEDKTITVQEYLGKPELAPGITEKLGCLKGTFRIPPCGLYKIKDFAMIHPLQKESLIPEYFGLAFD